MFIWTLWALGVGRLIVDGDVSQRWETALNYFVFFLFGCLAVRVAQNLTEPAREHTRDYITASFVICVVLLPLADMTHWPVLLFEPLLGGSFFLGWLEKYGLAWLSLLAWIVVAGASRPWVVALVLVTTIIAIFVGPSWSIKLAFLIGITVFLVNLHVGRLAFYATSIVFVALLFSTPFLVALFISDPVAWANRFPHIPMSILHRLFIWDHFVDLIASNPLLGAGLGSEAYAVPDQIKIGDAYPEARGPLTQTTVDAGGHPHSLSLMIWHEFGAFGAVIASIFLARVFASLRHLSRYSRAVAMATVSTGFMLFSTTWPIWDGSVQLLIWMAAIGLAIQLRRPPYEATTSNAQK